VVEHLLSKHKVLISKNPTTTKKKRKEKKKAKQKRVEIVEVL
jgi:hypothetical protein